MGFPNCHSGWPIYGFHRQRYCAHPQVHARGQLVTAEMCRICDFRSQDAPTEFRSAPPQDFNGYECWPGSVAVVIPCHNYGPFLGDCLDSVLRQSRAADEILVVDDSSVDNTAEVAESYRGRGVRYLPVNFRHPLPTRQAGCEATCSDVLCFLDADDRLDDDYLREGLSCFDSPNVGIVYSDMQAFGDETGCQRFPDTFDPAVLERHNFMHAGSLVRREALRASDAFNTLHLAQSSQQHADWLTWKRVSAAGWTARKQRGLYFYRKHANSMSRRRCDRSYFTLAGLAGESVTLFVPLSGRKGLWERFSAYLEQQTWSHGQLRLFLLETSGDPEFSKSVRQWAFQSDYRDVRVVSETGRTPASRGDGCSPGDGSHLQSHGT